MNIRCLPFLFLYSAACIPSFHKLDLRLQPSAPRWFPVGSYMVPRRLPDGSSSAPRWFLVGFQLVPRRLLYGSPRASICRPVSTSTAHHTMKPTSRHSRSEKRASASETEKRRSLMPCFRQMAMHKKSAFLSSRFGRRSI